MHIGGGPNDSATKAPFEKALQSSFGALQECCGSAGCTSGTLGVDLLVPKEGGRAEISNPRANLPDATLRCILAALGQVQFAPPRHGATKLSYSVRLSAPAP